MTKPAKPHVVSHRAAQAAGWASPRNLERRQLTLAILHALYRG